MKVSVKQLQQETNQVISPQVEKELNKRAAGTSVELESMTREEPLIEEVTRNNIIGAGKNLEKRKEMLEAKAPEPVDFAFERAIGRNDSLYSNFIEIMAITKRKIGRIVIFVDGERSGFGTGFMVSKNLLLTNWHVFPNADIARESEVHFGYELDTQGREMAPVIFKFDHTIFFTNQTLDYSFVGVQPVDVTGKIKLSSIGYLFLDNGLGKLGEKGIEKLNIIHHPQGDPKQISIRENTFDDVTDTKIFYLTDTAPGSSGSPVFNDQWQVVGLHHKSIAKMTSDGKVYLDKDDNPIPVVDGKIDQSRIVWIKNEGIRISVVLNHLKEANPGNQHLNSLAEAPPVETCAFVINPLAVPETEKARQAPVNEQPANDSEIRIQIPVSALNTQRSIDISLSSRQAETIKPVATSSFSANGHNVPQELLLEIAKVDKEKQVDFSACKGYDNNFLGVNIPLPQPKKAIQKEIALLKNKTNELKYFKYSVIFNAFRRMPLISAVNVEGDAKLRLDGSKRQDDWLRDSRIDVDVQLFDKFYAGSQFDKGHMSRFEDANWDKKEADAKRNGIYTCFYTNACPQVVALNRAGGFWGQLEKQILEKGVKKEAGKQARMTVFNGPVFDKDKDRLFKSVAIPMQFFKIICWLDDANKLKVTAFKLSQETLVDHIDFDEMARMDDLEALDIDKVTKFRKLQCTVKSLTKATNIDFSGLEKFDTFKAGGDEVELASAEEMML
jgi:endonuclease G, mitochondrial